ncbi:hypothetical protein GUJ93_ZPchr0006g40946 [Zizania palustris]|uniref:Uncharacterized protein n=1 Tax=Zizania palustris TaxID=103762 RepID=A0A8J5VVR4_ZIZPA|nr:hypothetical protein GUJ93_ZPchr0006g40946 [Zizania palustris]
MAPQGSRCGGGGQERKAGGGEGDVEAGGGGGERATAAAGGGMMERWACMGVMAGVAATGLAGAAVLVWWVVAFHPAHEQLWMVPVGLVLLGTPLITWLSLFASGACRWREDHLAPAVAPER